MSNPEHFRSRADAYRRFAHDSRDEVHAGDMFEIANLFNSMADDLARLRQPTPMRVLRTSGGSAALTWIYSAMLLFFTAHFKLTAP